jgi:WD40 repeat protein/tRNA A-37 threonylcarbamoyl transferase component Bud32
LTNLTGQTIDRYQIMEQLGQGGMAIVYLAYDARLDRKVAVKVIRQDAFPPAVLDKILKRFEREAKALGRLNHPNIVGIIDYGKHNGSPYLVMPYIPSGTLKEKLGKPIQYAEAAQILVPIARALAYAHAEDIIHRDIKPSNILITRSGEPVLTDFGIAKILEEVDGNTLTSTGMGLGTPEYMAPEQWRGKTYESTDQYALGVLFFEMITEHKPFSAATPPEVMLKQATEPLPKPRSFNPDLPEKVEYVILKMMDKNADQRYPNMQFLSFELEKIARNSLDQIIINNSNELQNNIQHSEINDIDTIYTENERVTFVKEKIEQIDKLNDIDKKNNLSHQENSSSLKNSKISQKDSGQIAETHKLVESETFDDLSEKKINENLDNNNDKKRRKISAPKISSESFKEKIIDVPNQLEEQKENNQEEDPIPLASNKRNELITKKKKQKWLWLLIGFGFIGALIFTYFYFLQPNDLARLYSLIQPNTTQTPEPITPTLSPTPTSTLAPTQESTPTFEPSPTFTPTSVAYKLPYIISPENANQVALIRNVGNGQINDLDYSIDGNHIAIASASGVAILDSGTLKTVNNINTGVWVESIEYSPNGEILAIGLNDFTIQIWNINTGQLKATLKGHTNFVTSLSFSPDGSLLASSSSDKSIIIWNVETAKLIKKLTNHSGEVFSVEYSPDGTKLLSGASDKTIRLWETEKFALLNTFTESKSYVDSVNFSPDGKFFAAGSRNGEIRIFELDTGKQVKFLDQKSGSINSICYSPDGKLIASGKWNAIVEIWNIESEEIILSTQNHIQTVSGITFSPEGNKLAVASFDTHVSLIDLRRDNINLSSGSELYSGEGYIRFSKDGISFYLIDSNSIKRLNVLTGENVYRKESINNGPLLTFSNDDNFIVRGKLDNSLEVINLLNGDVISNLIGHTDKINFVALSHNDQFIATSSSDKTIKIWQPFDGILVHSIEIQDGFVIKLEYLVDDKLLFIHTNNPSSIKIFNITSGEFENSYNYSGKVSPDGSMIASILDKRNIQLIDIKTGEILFKLTGHLGNVLDMKFISNGEKLLSLGKDNTIRIWNTKDGKLIKTYGGTITNFNNVIFSKTERYFATYADDGMVKFWDVEKGYNTQAIRAHSSKINGISISPDEKLLVTWSDDKTIKIWDLTTLKLLNTLQGHASGIAGVIFSPNGRILVSWSGKNFWENNRWVTGDATIRIWYIR